MPNRGGDWPKEFDRAAARADMPGPGMEELGAGPANGVKLPASSGPTPYLFGVGIC